MPYFSPLFRVLVLVLVASSAGSTKECTHASRILPSFWQERVLWKCANLCSVVIEAVSRVPRAVEPKARRTTSSRPLNRETLNCRAQHLAMGGQMYSFIPGPGQSGSDWTADESRSDIAQGEV